MQENFRSTQNYTIVQPATNQKIGSCCPVHVIIIKIVFIWISSWIDCNLCSSHVRKETLLEDITEKSFGLRFANILKKVPITVFRDLECSY